MTDPSPPPTDPVLVRRAKIARIIALGQRIGWTCFAGFVACIVLGLFTGFPEVVATTATVLLIVGCLTLAPAMTFVYALKAAEREDAERGIGPS